jgi:hypothetical protein
MCNPHDDEPRLREMARCGRCGDDDVVAFGASLGVAVLPAQAITLVSPDLGGGACLPMALQIALVFLTPPTPPPRFALS